MPRKPDEKTLNAKDKQLDPKAVLNVVINEMHNDDLEKALVDAGVATYIDEEN